LTFKKHIAILLAIMLTTPHALTGVTLVLIVPNKALALLLALLSHFMFDFFLPHWNPSIFTELKNEKKLSLNTVLFIVIDALLALIIVLTIAFTKTSNLVSFILVMLGAFMAILPDFIEIPYYFLGSQNKLLKLYVDFERKYQAKAGKFWGTLTQLVVMAVCFYIISLT